jgi:hypothetical protein
MLFLFAIAGWAAAQSEKPAARPLDSLKNLPPGTVIVVCDDLNAAKKLSANLILLTPKQYQDMLDEIGQARAKGRPEAGVPGECKLTGKVEGDLARVQAEFKFLTDRDGEPILLACRLGRPTAITLDGSLPVVYPGSKGLTVLVDKKGEHVAKLDLEISILPKGDRGSERGFELDLPGAAVTNLELAMPDNVAEAAVGVSTPDRPLSRLVPTVVEEGARRLKRFLGPATGLEISWKGPPPDAFGASQRTAQGMILIRVAESQIAAEAELKLKARGKPVTEWRLLVPGNARVMVKSSPGDDRPIGEIEAPDGVDKPLRVLRLKEPTLDTIGVVVQTEFQRGQGAVPIGPFAVEGADWQRGDVLVSAPAEVRLRVLPRGLLSPREVGADELRKDKEIKAAFAYWSIPAAEKPGGAYPPLLEVDVDSSRGNIQAQVEHFLQRTEDNWKLRTVLHLTPLAAGIEEFTVKLPADYRLQPPTPRSGEPTHRIKASVNAQIAEVKLGQRATQPFDLTLEGTYTPSPISNPVLLNLPLVQQAQGRGPHKVVIELLANQELGLSRDRDPAWDVERSRYNKQTWTTEQLPEHIEFTWQAHRQEVLLKSEADVKLTGNLGRVEQQMRFASGQTTADTRCRVPEEVSNLEVLTGGEWNPSTRILTLSRGITDNAPLRLRYTFAVRSEQEGGVFAVPLIAPIQEARCVIKLRITCETPALAEFVRGPWEEMPLEVMPKTNRLASLVLRGERPEDPPKLRLKEATALGAIGIDRVLIRSWVNEERQQSYRVSFLVNPTGARELDLEFPAPPAALNLRVQLDGQPASWGPPADAASSPVGGDPQHVARVPLGAAPRTQMLLDVWYQIAPGQIGPTGPSWAGAIGPLKTVLYPPRLRGQAGLGMVRWQVTLPPDWVVLCDDSTLPGDLAWVWRGRLVGTRPDSSNSDLEHWLAEALDNGSIDDGEPVYASAVGWSAELEPFTIRHAPRQAWLLGCSVALLAVALCLYMVRSVRFVTYLLLAGLVAGLLTVGVLWSGALPALLYGCEPGIAALLIIGAVQWFLRRRYRRQVAMLPGFKRVKSGGSVVIQNGGVNRPREPSTVDALPPVPSNQWATGSPSPSGVARAQAPGSSQSKKQPG